MADTDILLTANATQAVAEYKKLEAAIAQQEEKLKTLSGTAKTAAQEEMRDLKAAAAIKKAALSDQEKYDRQLELHNRLVQKGLLSQDEANKSLERHRRELEGSTAEAGKFGSAIENIKQSSVVSFSAAASAVALFKAGVEALNFELEKTARLQREALAENLTFGQAMRSTLLNFSGDDTVSTGTLEGEILKIATDTGARPADVATAAASAFSAKGSQSNRAALAAVREAMRLVPTDVGSATELSGRALDLMGQSGESDPRVALGLLLQSASSARPTSLASFGRAAVPAIGSTMAAGDSLEGSVELFTAMTSMMSDSTGEKASTATINLAERLRKFVPSAKGEDKRGKFKVPSGSMEEYDRASSTWERIGILQNAPELRRQFFAETSFDAASSAFIRQMLESDPAVLAKIEAARGAITGTEGAGERFEQKLAGINASQSQQILIPKAQREAADAVWRIEDPAGAASADARQAFETAMDSVDLPGWDSQTRHFRMRVMQAKEAAGVNAAEAAHQSLRGLIDANAKNWSHADRNFLEGKDTELKRLADLIEEQNRIMRDQARFPQRVTVENLSPPENPVMGLSNR